MDERDRGSTGWLSTVLAVLCPLSAVTASSLGAEWALAGLLWTLGADDCRFVIDALVEVGFLKWTPRRTVVRTGRDLPVGPEPQTANMSVRRPFRGNKSV